MASDAVMRLPIAGMAHMMDLDQFWRACCRAMRRL